MLEKNLESVVQQGLEEKTMRIHTYKIEKIEDKKNVQTFQD